MITKKELSYINTWPNKTPYPGSDYSVKVLEKLAKCFDLFNRKYFNKSYTIQFSNNEEIDFEILSKNICHMLGIDYKNLMKEFFTSYRDRVLGISPYETISSYELLGRIIEKGNDILNHDRNTQSCSAINYYRVGIKCDIFSKLGDLSKFNYGCINFDKDTFNRENPGEVFSPESTRLLFAPSDEVVTPYFMMGLKQDRNVEEETYIVETLIASEDPKKFFIGQEVVIPTQILTDDNGILDKNLATPEEKIKLLREYQNIVNAYGIQNGINIYGDYFSMLMSQREDESRLTLK